MKKHIFNKAFAFGVSHKSIFAVAVLLTFPAVAMAGRPSLGIGYSNVGLTGHSGRPGVTITAGNLYSNSVVASGSATAARGFYSMNASIGKLVPAGAVSFVPYVGMDFLNVNYSQPQLPSATDFYGLAGVDMNVPIGTSVMLQIGGGYGHTLMTYGGNGGSVYQGKAEIGFEVAPNVTANINVRYVHIPGQSMTDEGAGLSYHFS
ncbi:hypothetical protein HF289_08680 [Acidithiobacillus ferrooxidans]|uniref:hypothetical protein n=1 Tax=Acidithiobacillus ferrooxidans TaxID=920 RepID=UPI001C06958C|nr:hypothetical protein [Acidithiobacillus ferrooxidans]MBU2856945.1 hypothetical protein [Acidithiobacillus ferrooxidans]